MLCKSFVFCVILASNFLLVCVGRRMNTKRIAGKSVGEASVRGNQASLQAPDAGVQVPVNLVGLTDEEVRAALVQIDQAITSQAQDITAQVTREGAPRDNPHASTMARLRDFTRINPPVYFGSKTNKDSQEFVDEAHKILCTMGVQ